MEHASKAQIESEELREQNEMEAHIALHETIDQLRAQNKELVEALKELLPTAENWACNCEINGEGPNNPAAVVVKQVKAILAKAEGR